ncbi:Hypothetical protein NTJ_13612 [Nesidiocoris tenuis]|uniref:Uncharacterized protein n=1 Tax=Nesidiocoris tenuis TaxID=355587 RepID=A0ABN7B8U8_9HEMI|nr:Hypothetical protein NTJ_13612 [Nesidiocoris tenuis]
MLKCLSNILRLKFRPPQPLPIIAAPHPKQVLRLAHDKNKIGFVPRKETPEPKARLWLYYYANGNNAVEFTNRATPKLCVYFVDELDSSTDRGERE